MYVVFRLASSDVSNVRQVDEFQNIIRQTTCTFISIAKELLFKVTTFYFKKKGI